MERTKEKLQYSKKGITLISLVVTIIVLLILAGVTITTLTGDNGILSKAIESKNKTEKAQEKEGIELALVSIYRDVNKDSFQNAIDNHFGKGKSTVTENKDGSFTITFDDTDRMYYVDNSGEVIENDNILKISTAEELKAFRDDVNNGNSYEGWYVYLGDNITLDENEKWEPIGLYPNESPTPDDEKNKPFSGIFDGCSKKIDGIYINTTNKIQGLFGLVDNGKILNLSIGQNCSINGGRGTAGVVGYIYNGSTVKNCYNKANINGQNSYASGIVGIAYMNCKITDTYNDGSVKAANLAAGGIVGYANDDIYVQNSHNSGSIVSEKDRAGGIAGSCNGKVNIENCYNEATVTGKSEVGGIAGANNSDEGTINQCYNKNNIEAVDKNTYGNSNVGGIVGLNVGTITNCYNKGTVTSKYSNAGGIIGGNRGTLKNTYNVGIVNCSASNVGAIAGSNESFYNSDKNMTFKGKIYNTFSLEGVAENLVGINESIIGTECSFKSNTDMQEIYSILGGSFKRDSNGENDGFPILNWQKQI